MEQLNTNMRSLMLIGFTGLALGILAIVAPFQSSVNFEIWIGVTFILVGIGHAIHSFWSRIWGGFFFQLFGGVQYLLVGLMLLANADSNAVTFTLLLAMLLIMQGVIQFGLSSELESKLSRTCMFASGTVAVILGVLIWLHWPSGATLVVGLFVGIHLLLRGSSVLVLAVSIRQDRRLNLSRLRQIRNNEEPTEDHSQREGAAGRESLAHASATSGD